MNLLSPFKWLFPSPQEAQQRLPLLHAMSLKQGDENSWFLSIAPVLYANQFIWDYFQRDLILDLLSGLFVMVHLDGFGPFELDDDLRELCPYQADAQGKTLLLAGDGLLRLVTELQSVYDEYWEYGDFINFTAFTAPPALDFPPDTDIHTLPGFALNIQPSGDDLGLTLDCNPAVFPAEQLCGRVRQLAAAYRLRVDA